MDQENKPDTFSLEIVAEIVSAYVSNNPVAASDLPTFIADVHQSINQLSQRADVATPSAKVVKTKPAVSIKKSVSDDKLICLNCGKAHKSLKRQQALF